MATVLQSGGFEICKNYAWKEDAWVQLVPNITCKSMVRVFEVLTKDSGFAKLCGRFLILRYFCVGFRFLAWPNSPSFRGTSRTSCFVMWTLLS